MDKNLKEILKKYYEPSDEEGWYICRDCRIKLYASETRTEDLLRHEIREHPER